MRLKTWGDVKCWADVLEPGIKETIWAILAKTPNEKRCPNLGVIVEHGKAEFAYCGVDRDMYIKIGYGEESPAPTLNDPRYPASVDWGWIQICTGNFKKCVDYAGKERAKVSA